jgi:hypothetical protein
VGRALVVIAFIAPLLLLALPGDGETPEEPAHLVVSKRGMRIDAYPCSQCHENWEAWNGADKLKGSPHWRLELDHMKRVERCDICHDYPQMENFRLITGEKVGFDDSHLVCGQCHAGPFKDWKLGLHGKTVGSWQRDKTKHRLTCADCHDAHAPRRPAQPSEAQPPFPRFGIRKGAH